MMTVARDSRAYLETELDRKDLSPLGLVVAAILDDIWGLYNLRRFSTLWTAPWQHETMITVCLSGGLATFDGDQLTQLVVRCHDACVRLVIEPLNARQQRMVFSRRYREGAKHDRHPSLEDAIAHVRGSSYYGAGVSTLEAGS